MEPLRNSCVSFCYIMELKAADGPYDMRSEFDLEGQKMSTPLAICPSYKIISYFGLLAWPILRNANSYKIYHLSFAFDWSPTMKPF